MERAVLDDELIQGEKDLNQDLIDFLNSKEWKKFYYEIDLYLTFQPMSNNPQSYLPPMTTVAKFSFLHMAIITKNIKVLRHMIETEKEALTFSDGKLLEKNMHRYQKNTFSEKF